MYTPSVEFERRVPSSVIQFVGQYHRHSGSETESLTIDARYQFPVTIPYSPMLVNYAALTVPQKIEFLAKV